MIFLKPILSYPFVSSVLLAVLIVTPALSFTTLSDDELDAVSAAGEKAPTPLHPSGLWDLSDPELDEVDWEGWSIPFAGLPLEAAHRMSGLSGSNSKDLGRDIAILVGETFEVMQFKMDRQNHIDRQNQMMRNLGSGGSSIR